MGHVFSVKTSTHKHYAVCNQYLDDSAALDTRS